jgi:signal transduction histidine kinase
MKLSTFGLLHRSLSEQQFSWIIRFLFGASLLLIIALSYSYHNISKELIYYSEKVDQTQRVINRLNEVSEGVSQTTYMSNTFLFSKDTLYTNKTLAAMKSLPKVVEKLDSMIAAGTPQKKRVAYLKAHLNEFYNYTIAIHGPAQTSVSAQATEFLYTRRNIEIDLIEKLIAEMNVFENKLMHNRVQSRDNYMQQAFSYNWIIMLVAIIFLAAAFLLLDRELRRNKLYRVDLENKVENLNRSNSELEQFAYIASHDLQEPLRKIRSFSDRTISKYREELSEDVFHLLRKIDDSSTRMQVLINDLLSFSRIVNTGAQLKMVSLSTSLSVAKSNLSEMMMETNGTIQSEPLPTVEAYGTQMIQLFQNLLSNSLKYHRKNVRPVIKITHRLVDGEIIPKIKPAHRDIQFHQIKISDNGIGFEKEFSEKIFVIFQRLHDRTQFEGTGIGLAICRRIVSNHNGYIFAESPEGEGANFYIYLPTQSLLS